MVNNIIHPFPVDREPAGSAEGQRETTGRLERQSQIATDGHLQYRHGAGNPGGGSGREGTHAHRGSLGAGRPRGPSEEQGYMNKTALNRVTDHPGKKKPRMIPHQRK